MKSIVIGGGWGGGILFIQNFEPVNDQFFI